MRYGGWAGRELVNILQACLTSSGTGIVDHTLQTQCHLNLICSSDLVDLAAHKKGLHLRQKCHASQFCISFYEIWHCWFLVAHNSYHDVTPPSGPGPKLHEHTPTHHTRYESSEWVIGRTQRPLPDIIQHSQEKDIHTPAGLETATPANEGPQTLALDRVTTGTGYLHIYGKISTVSTKTTGVFALFRFHKRLS